VTRDRATQRDNRGHAMTQEGEKGLISFLCFILHCQGNRTTLKYVSCQAWIIRPDL
jgi:hypothetical protein